jgi:translation initiation factor 2 alpha subunit (eIF-2alpha)
MVRYYRKSFPDCNDTLIAKITEFSDSGVYADSIEYPGLKLFIPKTEISKYNVNLQKLFSSNDLYPVLVLNTYKDKNIADVSYIKLSDKERNEHLEKFSIRRKIYRLGLEANKAYSLFSGTEDCSTASYIFGKTVWPIFEHDSGDKCYLEELYTSLLEDPHKLFVGSESEQFNEYKEHFVQDVKKKIKISDVVLTIEISLLCTENNAIERIKNTLKINSNVQIRYKSPKYELIATANDKTNAMSLLRQAIDEIKDNCERFKVSFVKQGDVCVLKDKTYVFQPDC